MAKETLRLERIFKGVANHRRMEILQLLHRQPDLSLREICRRLRIEYKTGFEHVRRLTLAGLVVKRPQGRDVLHRTSDRGQQMLRFARQLID